jgi:VanZ family protein
VYKNIIKSWLPVLLWAAIIFFFSAAELLGQFLHFLEYAVLVFLLARAFYKTASTQSIYTVIIASLFAFSDEIHQLFVPGRAFQLIDLIIDFIGILFGVFLYTRLKIEPQRHEDSIPPG